MTQFWTSGFTRSELNAAQERYGINFPPDLFDLLMERRPINGYDWAGDDGRIHEMLAWPLESLLWDVENGSWWLDWGERPSSVEERTDVIRSALAEAPRLIPIFSHRFIPETPSAAGNPVFSMYGFDTIYYGANLDEYFANEIGGSHLLNGMNQAEFTLADTLALPRSPFWSDLAIDQNRRVRFDYE